MEYPIEFVADIPVKLSAYKPFGRGEHIVIVRITGAGGIEKSDSALIHYI
jgi:hypothetical protein